MKLSLGSDDLVHFREYGWHIARGACDPAQVRALRDAWDELFARFPMAVADVTGGGMYQLTSPCRLDPTLASLLTDGDLGRAAAQVLACDEVRLLQDVALLKPALVGGRIGWHQDYDYAGYLTPIHTVAFRIALDTEDVESGAMAVIDGSHTWDVRLRVAERNWFIHDGALETLAPSLREQIPARTRVLALAPGDVSIHHCLTLHGSGPNHSEYARRTLGFQIFDGACRLNVAALADPSHAAYFELDGDGHLIGESFPRLFPVR